MGTKDVILHRFDATFAPAPGGIRHRTALRRIAPRWLYWFTVLVGLASYFGFLFHPATTGFGPDSWSYYDLSQTVFGDFYRPASTRSFTQADGYSRSFPPLWPVVLALAGKGLAAGPALAVALAAVSAILTILPLRWLTAYFFQRRTVALWAATGAWLGLLWFPAYWSEVRSGGSIPLAILCLTLGLAGAVRGRLFLAGLLWGAACLTRFDAALVCALFLAGALWRFRTRPVAIAGMILAFGATVAPWIYYSEHHYGSLWASDNATVVAASSPVFVQDFHAPAGTLRTEPVRWAGRVAGNSVKLALAVGHAVLAQPLLLLALAAVFSLRQRAAWKTGGQIGWMTAAAAAGLAGCALTGYVDRRYFSFVTLLGACWVMGIALHSTRRFRLALAFAALLSPFFGLEWLREEYGGGMKSRRMPESIRLELERDHAHSVVLADSFCYEAGARTRVSTVCLPTDWTKLTGVQRQDFLTQLGITHAIRFEGAGYRIAAHPQPEWPIQDR